MNVVISLIDHRVVAKMLIGQTKSTRGESRHCLTSNPILNGDISTVKSTKCAQKMTEIFYRNHYQMLFLQEQKSLWFSTGIIIIVPTKTKIVC